jgi:hypothetical protein
MFLFIATPPAKKTRAKVALNEFLDKKAMMSQ